MTDVSVTVETIRARRESQGEEIHQTLAALPTMTYTQYLRLRSEGHMDRPALSFGEKIDSYTEMFARIDAARGALREKGVQPGQAVALLIDNSDTYIVWYLAVLEYGAIAVPLNTKLVAREVDYILRHSESKLVVAQTKFDELVASVCGTDNPIVVLNTDVWEESDTSSVDIPAPHKPAGFDEACALYYTSGTTGAPKGVVHTHGSQIASTLQCPPAWEYALDPLVALAVTPLFHIAAHTISLPVLALGGTLIVEPYRTDNVLRILADRKVTSFFAVPSILMMLVERAREQGMTFPEMRSVQFGAAPMPAHKLTDVQQLFPNAALLHGMGQTESSGTLVTLASEIAFERAGSVGLAMPGTTISIFNEKDEPAAPGEVGELVAQGPNVMQGYFKNEEATAFTLRGGWLHSGDLGYRDEDGLVFLVDRQKDMIIRGGENIYSTEVEDVLMAFPAVSQAAVVGKPDSLFGEIVCAFVILKASHADVTAEQIIDHCRVNLASFKVPAELHIEQELPMTATGKIRKNVLKDRFD